MNAFSLSTNVDGGNDIVQQVKRNISEIRGSREKIAFQLMASNVN